METCQPLATESFSYSWLTKKTPFDDLDEYLRSPHYSSNESTPRETNFNFDTSISKSSFTLVHADEIFSNGHIMPIYVDRSKVEAFNTSASVPSIPISSLYSRSTTAYPEDRTYCHFLRKWRKSSKRILQKFFGVFRPLCQKVGCPRKSIRVDDIDRKVWEVQSQGNSLQASPRQSTAWSDIEQINRKNDYRRLRKVKSWSNMPQEYVPQGPSYSTDVSCEIESSIYEAVLHCKRSFEN